MKLITILTIAVANAAPVIFPINKNESNRVICSTWMMKTNESVLLKIGDSIFKPNVEYSTSSLVKIGQKEKFTITNTDEIFDMNDFFNMMNYDKQKFIFWSINGSFKFYNCIKQNAINPKLTNSTLTTLDNKNSIDIRGCINNIDCIENHCQNMVYVKDTLKCYPKTDNGDVHGYYISIDNNW